MLASFACMVIYGNAQVQINAFAGPQLSSSKYTVNGVKQPSTSKTGFHLGAGMKIPFENHLYFSPSLFYSMKGYKVKFNQRAYPPDTTAIDNTTTIHTVELALLLQYDFSMQPNHFFLKAGPSLDFQLSGKEKFTKYNGTVVDRKMPFSYGDYGHYAASLVLQLGYETGSGFLIAAGYTHGMGSINNADYGPRIRHRVYGLTLGKLLVTKK